ncbi:MAG: hypothetical protein EOO43_25765, partial [Flavobacterium sp.]
MLHRVSHSKLIQWISENITNTNENSSRFKGIDFKSQETLYFNDRYCGVYQLADISVIVLPKIFCRSNIMLFRNSKGQFDLIKSDREKERDDVGCIFSLPRNDNLELSNEASTANLRKFESATLGALDWLDLFAVLEMNLLPTPRTNLFLTGPHLWLIYLALLNSEKDLRSSIFNFYRSENENSYKIDGNILFLASERINAGLRHKHVVEKVLYDNNNVFYSFLKVSIKALKCDYLPNKFGVVDRNLNIVLDNYLNILNFAEDIHLNMKFVNRIRRQLHFVPSRLKKLEPLISNMLNIVQAFIDLNYTGSDFNMKSMEFPVHTAFESLMDNLLLGVARRFSSHG